MLTFEDCAAFVGADQDPMGGVEKMGSFPALERMASLSPVDTGIETSYTSVGPLSPP